MANDGRISLKSDLQFKHFTQAMNVLRENKLQLTAYDRKFFQDLDDGLDMFGRDLHVTTKQFNHLRMVAWDLESGA